MKLYLLAIPAALASTLAPATSPSYVTKPFPDGITTFLLKNKIQSAIHNYKSPSQYPMPYIYICSYRSDNPAEFTIKQSLSPGLPSIYHLRMTCQSARAQANELGPERDVTISYESVDPEFRIPLYVRHSLGIIRGYPDSRIVTCTYAKNGCVVSGHESGVFWEGK